MLVLQCDPNVTKNLQWLRGRSELCDVVVVNGEGQQCPAHSCVLAAHSTVIAAVLQGRLAAARDWSVMRPLIISIDDATLKNTAPKEESEGNSNALEALVRLMYGETVNALPSHLPLFLQYAEMLGLSHQILDCLQSKVPITSEDNLTTDVKCQKKLSRKKHSRKPILEKGDKTTERETENKFYEQSLVELTVSEEKVDILQEKQAKFQITDAFEERSDVDSSMLDLSMLCSDVQSLNGGLGSNWTLVQGQDQNNVQPSITDLQESHDSVAGFEDEASLERMSGSTNDPPMEDLSSKLDFTSQGTEMETEGSSCTINEGTNDILIMVVNAEQQQPICSGETQQLQQKKQQKQKSVGKGLVCAVCGSAFQRCGDLVKHVQNMQHFTAECPVCFVQVPDLEDQRLHFALHDQELPFFCMYCDLRFRTRAALTMHTPKHSTSKPFVCSDCGRGFKWRHALQAHLYTHSPTVRLLCDICGFSSKYVSSFKAHLLQHSGRAFPCPHPGCTFTSKRKAHLNDHLATHSKTRVHQCEVCGHSFSHAKNMRRHMRLHAPASNLLTCLSVSKLQCNFRTTRPDKLQDHLAKKHNISRQALSSSDSITKLLSTSSVSSRDASGTQKQAPESVNVSNFTTSEAPNYSLVQTSAADITGIEKLPAKPLDPESIASIVEEHVGYQTEEQAGKSIDGHTGIATPQDNFSVLVNSSDLGDLSDIQSLANHSNQTEKQDVPSLTDEFPPGFLVEHNILLNKPDAGDVTSNPHLGPGNMSAIQGNLVSGAEGKMHIPVHQNALQDQGNMQLVTGTHVQVSYSQHCTFARTDNVVLEDSVTVNEMSTSSGSHGSNILLDEDDSQKKNDKQEQCMESLNILEFMLDSVTD